MKCLDGKSSVDLVVLVLLRDVTTTVGPQTANFTSSWISDDWTMLANGVDMGVMELSAGKCLASEENYPGLVGPGTDTE